MYERENNYSRSIQKLILVNVKVKKGITIKTVKGNTIATFLVEDAKKNEWKITVWNKQIPMAEKIVLPGAYLYIEANAEMFKGYLNLNLNIIKVLEWPPREQQKSTSMNDYSSYANTDWNK